jgi:ribonuclease D
MGSDLREQANCAPWIDTPKALESFLLRCADSDILVIDTEFLREKTYYPQLCLLQLATRDHLALIDPLAIMDLSPLTSILTNPAITKVFHAGDQDRAILFQEVGVGATPVFDTQWASMVLGLPLQVSLASLVHHYTGIELAKADSFSDWSARPLTERQMKYAASDVCYLPDIYDRMLADLTRNNRYSWLQQDFAKMVVDAQHINEPAEMWLKVKHRAALTPQQLACLRELAGWRERTAQSRNLPRKWIVPDELLVEIVRNDPDDLESLVRIRGRRERVGRRWAEEVLASLRTARALPKAEWPKRERPHSRRVDNAAAQELMNALVHLRARELHIAPNYLAPGAELKSLASGEESGLTLLSGWRRELIGDELKALLEGNLALYFRNGELKVTVVPQ